jgi:hypothetical protein
MTSWLVVGLGNPGPAFASHRHNIGYRVVEELARRMQLRFRVVRGIRAEVADGRIGPPGGDGPRLILAKSRTFMNETGWAVTRLLAYYKLEPPQMIVVHDELDIDVGQLRVKFGGGGQRSQRPEVDPGRPRHRGTFIGYASALAVHPAARIQPIFCSATSLPARVRTLRSRSVAPRMQWNHLLR